MTSDAWPDKASEIDKLFDTFGLSDEGIKRLRAELRIWVKDDSEEDSRLPDPRSTIIFPDGTIRYKDSELVDPRLEMLFEFGMPADQSRVIQKYNGDFFGKKYKKYTVEVLSVSLNEVTNPKGDNMLTGGASYYRRNDGQVGIAHHWLRRLRYDGTVAMIEDLWHPKLGWQTIIANNEHPFRLVREVKLLADGFICLRHMDTGNPSGRTTGSGKIDTIPPHRMEKVLSYLCAYYKGNRSDLQQLLADYLSVSRWTIGRYLKSNSLDWKNTLNRAKKQSENISKEDFQKWQRAFRDGKNPIEF